MTHGLLACGGEDAGGRCRSAFDPNRVRAGGVGGWLHLLGWLMSVGLVLGLGLARAAEVTLAWDPNPESDVVGYRVYQGTESRVYSQVHATDRTTSLTVTELAEGMTYYFAVTALNSSGLESDYSNEVVYTAGLSSRPDAPVIVLTSPVEGATYLAPANVVLQASVESNGQTIQRVRFLNGSTVLGEDASAPYAFTWSGVAGGQYALSAQAVYGEGRVVGSDAVGVQVTGTAPTVALTSPTASDTFEAPATVTIRASVQSNGSTIHRVRFFRGSTFLGEDTTAPYEFTWSGVPGGTYRLSARAIYGSSLVARSAPVDIQVTGSAPTVVMQVPAPAGGFVAPASLSLGAQVTANGFPVTAVRFFQGSTLLGEDVSAPYQWNWNDVQAGSYSLRARVLYGVGLSVDSPVVWTTVAGLPPPWEVADVGLPQGPALIRSEGEGVLMEAAGPLAGVQDTFRFAYQTLTDDGEITARLDAMTGAAGEDVAGVMIRESLAPDAAYVFMGAAADGAFRFQRRSVTAGDTAWKRSVGSPLGRSWVRVFRRGDRLVALRSLDRLSWTQIGSVTAVMSRTAVMGLVVASRSSDTPIQATFGDLNVIP